MPKKTLILIIAFSLFFTLLLLFLFLRQKSLQKTIIEKTVPPQITSVPQIPTPKESLIKFNTVTPTLALVPTTIPTPTPAPLTYQTITTQDDAHSLSKLILKDSNQKETIIRVDAYQVIPGQNTIKPTYTDIVFSPDNSFFAYAYSGFGKATSLYGINGKQFFDLNFYADTLAFTPDSKYLYGCARGGKLTGGAIVKQLPQLSIDSSVFQENSFTCKYDPSNKQIYFYGYKDSNTTQISSEYVLSTQTGSITKTKQSI